MADFPLLLRRFTTLRLLLVAAAFALTAGHAAEKAPALAAPPSWVSPHPAPSAVPPPPTNATAYGRRYLLIETQTHVPSAASYYHNIYQILNTEGLREGSQVQLSFDPAYETLTLHHVRIRRGDQVIDKLDPAKLQTIRRERDLDAQLYNGELTTLLELDDVRVGDAVDLAFTRQGTNPVFGNHFLDSHWLSWGIPVERQHLRIICGDRGAVRHLSHGPDAPALQETATATGRELTWTGENLTPLVADEKTPSWYLDFAHVQLTDFASWSEVVQWALPLYGNSGEPDPEIATRLASIRAATTTPDAQALAALDFVQDDIRYLGLEMGAGSHKPSAPALVCQRRYGDCKDKARLLCTLLQGLGFRAAPVLVNTSLRHVVRERLPSPLAFDHVVVALWLDGRVYQLDPTVPHQRGPLAKRHTDRYGVGLVITPDTTDLTKFPDSENDVARTGLTETFDVKALEGETDFRVTTVYRGRAARSMRETLQDTSPEALLKSYRDYYGRFYPDIVSTEPLKWDDDPEANILSTHEHYRITGLFQKKDGTTQLRAEFYPSVLSGHTTSPGALGRTTPLALSHPTDIRSRTTINLPEDWGFTPVQQTENGPAIDFERTIRGTPRSLELSYHWRTKADHVKAADFAAHVRQLGKINEVLDYQLTYTPADPSAAKAEYQLNWWMVALAVVIVAAFSVVAWRILRATSAEPPVVPNALEQDLVGIGGWLTLMAIGAVSRPFLLASQLAGQFSTYFDLHIWQLLTTPGTASYREGYAPLIAMELCGNLVVFLTACLVPFLMFRRQRQFPPVMTFLLIFQVVFVGLDTFLASRLFPDNASAGDAVTVFQLAIFAAVWVPYLRVSRRVKLTFTR